MESESLENASARTRCSVNKVVGRNLRVAWCATRSSNPLVSMSSNSDGGRQMNIWDIRDGLNKPVILCLSVSLCLSLSVCLSHTLTLSHYHTHTHTHTHSHFPPPTLHTHIGGLEIDRFRVRSVVPHVRRVPQHALPCRQRYRV